MEYLAVGNVSVIIPREVQASLLRKSLSEEHVMYVICLVSTTLPASSLQAKRRTVAPSIFMPLYVAVCIFIVTGERSDSRRPSRCKTIKPARQLGQPVSAIAGSKAVLVSRSK